MKQIPVYVISGLLESGKTTFIKDTITSDDYYLKNKTLVLSGEEYSVTDGTFTTTGTVEGSTLKIN